MTCLLGASPLLAYLQGSQLGHLGIQDINLGMTDEARRYTDDLRMS